MLSSKIAKTPLPAARIVRALSGAAERWSNADYPPRVRTTAALIARMGYSEPMVDYGLDQLFKACTEKALVSVVERELGDITALDGFAARKNQPDIYARGVDHVAIIASRTTIGVALPATIYAIIAKTNILVKDREDGFMRTFFQTLIEEEPLLAPALRAESWSGADPERLANMDVVVAFGDSNTLKTIRNGLANETRFIGFGPRISCGIFNISEIHVPQQRTALFMQAARDMLLYEAEGCMSLHLIFVKTNELPTSPWFAEVAHDMLAALDVIAIEFPPARRSAADQLGIAATKSSLRFKASINDGCFIEQAQHAVLITASEPPPLTPGICTIIPVADDQAIAVYLATHQLRLEAVSVVDPITISSELAELIGVARVTTFGCLQQPPFSGEHGGRPRLLDFVDLVTRES
jgi:hypothetical protein